jgi:asparagine synthase (glutamine-hydrolysing)
VKDEVVSMVEVILRRNKGYKWYTDGTVYFKGYLQKYSGEVLREERALEALENINSLKEFEEYLSNCFGVFAIIIKRSTEVWIASDIARSIPIYYTDDGIIVSDDVDEIVNYKEVYAELDSKRMLELYATSYVAFNNTVYRHVKQVELGMITVINGDVAERKPYFVHSRKSTIFNDELAISMLTEKTNKMCKRIIKALDGRKAVISLSGGYDSRYIACSLKDNGLDEAICYTYGRTGSFEVEQSHKVALALGYEWYNIQYDIKEIRNLINEDDYFDYANRPDYMAYLQNYYAVKKLKEDKMIPDDAVFITGLCNDMPTGSYVPSETMIRSTGFTNKAVAEYNIKQRFARFEEIDIGVMNTYIDDVLAYFDIMGVSVKNYESFVSALNCIETAEGHSRAFLNMNEVHSYFGYEWLLPCWDQELLDFWYNVSPDLRLHQYLYEKYIMEKIGKKYGVGTKKHLNMHSRSYFLSLMKRKIGGLVVRLAYPMGIPVKRGTDINNFALLEVELYKRIVQKKAIKPDRAAITLLLTIFMMERRYGKNWYKDIKPYIK